MPKNFLPRLPSFCCSNGEILLAINDISRELYDLYTSESKNSSKFQRYIRTHNNSFAFTSFGVRYDKELCKRNKGIYMFRVQGQIYHLINELLPSGNHPSILQFYFYDQA